MKSFPHNWGRASHPQQIPEKKKKQQFSSVFHMQWISQRCKGDRKVIMTSWVLVQAHGLMDHRWSAQPKSLGVDPKLSTKNKSRGILHRQLPWQELMTWLPNWIIQMYVCSKSKFRRQYVNLSHFSKDLYISMYQLVKCFQTHWPKHKKIERKFIQETFHPLEVAVGFYLNPLEPGSRWNRWFQKPLVPKRRDKSKHYLEPKWPLFLFANRPLFWGGGL